MSAPFLTGKASGLDFPEDSKLPLFIQASLRLIPRQEGAAREQRAGRRGSGWESRRCLAGCLPSARPSQSGMINEARFSSFPRRSRGALLAVLGVSLVLPARTQLPWRRGRLWLHHFCCFLSLSAASHAPSPFPPPFSPCCASGSRAGTGRMLRISAVLKAPFPFEAGLFFQPFPVCC